MWDVIRKLWHDGYPVIGTLFMMQASRAVTYETTLAFFGLGDPLLKTWGRLIRSALNYENLRQYLVLVSAPGNDLCGRLCGGTLRTGI